MTVLFFLFFLFCAVIPSRKTSLYDKTQCWSCISCGEGIMRDPPACEAGKGLSELSGGAVQLLLVVKISNGPHRLRTIYTPQASTCVLVGTVFYN